MADTFVFIRLFLIRLFDDNYRYTMTYFKIPHAKSRAPCYNLIQGRNLGKGKILTMAICTTTRGTTR